MGFFDFLKKKESFMDKGPALDMDAGFRDETGLGQPSFQSQQPFPSRSSQQQMTPLGGFGGFETGPSHGAGMVSSKDTELILAKLDAIKAILENLSQRVQNLESKQQEKKYW